MGCLREEAKNHIYVKHHLRHEAATVNEISVIYIPTVRTAADLFIKPLERVAYRHCMKFLQTVDQGRVDVVNDSMWGVGIFDFATYCHLEILIIIVLLMFTEHRIS